MSALQGQLISFVQLFVCLFEDRLWYIVDKNIKTVSLSKGGRKVQTEDYCKEIPTNFCRSIRLITCVFELLWTVDACLFFNLLSYFLLPFLVLSAKQVEEQIKATLHEQESFEASIASRWV